MKADPGLLDDVLAQLRLGPRDELRPITGMILESLHDPGVVIQQFGRLHAGLPVYAMYDVGGLAFAWASQARIFARRVVGEPVAVKGDTARIGDFLDLMPRVTAPAAESVALAASSIGRPKLLDPASHQKPSVNPTLVLCCDSPDFTNCALAWKCELEGESRGNPRAKEVLFVDATRGTPLAIARLTDE